MNDAVLHNTFSHDGYYGNPSNSDYGQIVYNAGQPQNCFAGNDRAQRQRPTEPGADPTDLRQDHHRLQHRRAAPQPGAVRHRVRLVPGRGHLPAAHRCGHAPPSPGPADHARPVHRSAGQRLVLGREAGLSGR